jgi:TolA-binding protein
MFPKGTLLAHRFAAALSGVFLIAGQPAQAAAPPAAPAPIARPAAPAPRLPAPAMAPPSAPTIHRAPAPQAIVPQPTPQFAAPLHQAAPRFAAPRTMEEMQQQQQAIPQQRDALSRQIAERQPRIDRLQQRVQQLQTQQPEGRRAQRVLEAQKRLLEREQLTQQRDLAWQQKLDAQLAAPQLTAAAAAVRPVVLGRFAARFRNNADPHARVALAARLNGWTPHMAWRRHVRAAFVAWLGPVFWPYAYADIFEYTFWPSAYDDAYWAYAYDDCVDTAFWDMGSPNSVYNIAADGYLEPGSAMVGSSQLLESSGLSPQDLRQLCSNPDKGITAWPFADIARVVRPTAEQRDLIDQLKHAAAQAAGAFKNSCSDDYALTPPGRLQAMINRISATLEAVRIVRPALEAFYNSLSDEQQARFNTLGPQYPSASEDRPQRQTNEKTESCAAPKASLTQLPIERINAVLHPTGAQKDSLDRLSMATEKSVQILQAACPDEMPVTPVGRLQAIEKRLSTMLEAANELQPALNEFYASLTSEQKARFNTLQQVAGH